MATKKQKPKTKKSPTAHLEDIKLFSACSAKDLAKIVKAADRVAFKPGDVLTTQGTAGKQAFIILSGTVAIKRNGRKIATAEAGTMIGELSLLDNGSRTASAICDTDCDILVLEHRKFFAVIDEVPALSHKLLSSLATTVRVLNNKHFD
jgi:CRP-like cAMP-binding protein